MKKYLTKNEKVYSVILVIKDIFKFLIVCLVVNILLCTCLTNGWTISGNVMEITHNEFWSIYKLIISFIPIIVFLLWLSGHYNVEIKYYSEPDNMPKAKCVIFRRIK